MDFLIIIKVITGEYHGKCDVYSGVSANKCRRNFTSYRSTVCPNYIWITSKMYPSFLKRIFKDNVRNLTNKLSHENG